MLADDVAFSHNITDKTDLQNTLHKTARRQKRYINNRDYDRALRMGEEGAEAKSQYDAVLRGREGSRQKTEQERFQAARQLILDQHSQEWEQRTRAHEDKLQERLRTLDGKHDEQVEQLSDKIDRETGVKRDIHSKYVRDMLLTESKLAMGGKFEEAKQVRRKIQEQEKAEIDSFARTREDQKRVKIQRLIDRQETEKQMLRQELNNVRVLFNREMETADKCLAQRLKNLESDMHHAHRTEFHPGVVPLVTPTLAQERRDRAKTEHRKRTGAPHGTRPGRQSTYRGSQMLVRMQGKYPLPSLCQMYDPESPVYSPSSQTESNMSGVMLNSLPPFAQKSLGEGSSAPSTSRTPPPRSA